jgi:hypothetical protein
MRKRAHQLLTDLWRRLRSGHDDRRAARARARFWAELREGEREAAAQALARSARNP